MDWKQASADDKALLLGEAFRNIEVVGVEFSEGLQLTRVLIGGEVVTLVGDPEEALTVYLGGRGGVDERAN